jgi:hypothetical protein
LKIFASNFQDLQKKQKLQVILLQQASKFRLIGSDSGGPSTLIYPLENIPFWTFVSSADWKFLLNL